MSWITPIIDRTQADVNLVLEYDNIGYNNLTPEQKAVWNAGMKGALNASDLNRIENNIQYLASILELYNLNIKTNWQMSDVPRNNDFNRILSNLNALKDKFHLKYDISLPETPDLPLNSYEKINDIENILYIINQSFNFVNFITSDGKVFVTSDGKIFMVAT
jgi:hypothetical protein